MELVTREAGIVNSAHAQSQGTEFSMSHHQQPAILHLIDTTGPGGAETIFTQLAQVTQSLGYRTIAVIRGPGWVASELERLGIVTQVMDCKGSFNLHFLKQLGALIHRENIQVIQSHLLGSNVYASLAGLLTRTPVFSTFHGFVDVSPTERLRWLKFLLIQLGSNNVIAVTEQMRVMLQVIPTLARSKVITIANGVDTTIFTKSNAQPLRTQYQLAEDAIIIGCLGNVRRAKDYNLAIETLHQLREAGVNAKLFIAGDDKNSLADEHRQTAQQLGVTDSIIWLGFFQDTPGFLNALDIFLLSSSSEGHPLALTQAMAVGVPIVATRCGIEEIVTHNETALLAPVGDAVSLAAEIQRLLIQPELKQTLIINAQHLAQEQLSLDAMRNQYVALYSPLLEKPKQHFILNPSPYIARNFGSKKGLLRFYYFKALNTFTGRYKKYQKIPAQIERIVFVCKGNICRSALAEQYFKSISNFPVASIGLDTQSGKPANPRVLAAAQTLAIDLSNHRTTAIEDFQAKPNDIYICMEPAHLNHLTSHLGDVNIALLGLFGAEERIYLHDPYTAKIDYVHKCNNFIINAVSALNQQLSSR